ncbi:hypothetical protein Micbo1qcDRAFT_164036 [Microdochium bolleyi]|uniref:Uncharacterized protein n=1 Tax=Microdochium bolleyi TaxID=196109 RepID=A0A136IZQ3_9PEZI|nr:hypothetical protein Micbo1qcDRAFT_164036 [Microdochium bolleyi]
MLSQRLVTLLPSFRSATGVDEAACLLPFMDFVKRPSSFTSLCWNPVRATTIAPWELIVSACLSEPGFSVWAS